MSGRGLRAAGGLRDDDAGRRSCRRHGGAVPEPPLSVAAVPVARSPESSFTPVERRLRGPGRPTRDPLKLVRVILTCARRAGFPFEEAYDLAASTSLAYMSDRRAEEGWEALTRDRAAWADAYRGSR